jgi:peptide/nickel transport system substrate-binding protein
MRNRQPALGREARRRVKEELRRAYDFDPRDPLFGLSRSELSGPRLDQRTTLRLLAAAGTLSAWHLMPGLGARRAAAQSGGELSAGWAGVGEVRTLDPAQINQVLQFQISSNVLSGLTHINPELAAEGDLA